MAGYYHFASALEDSVVNFIIFQNKVFYSSWCTRKLKWFNNSPMIFIKQLSIYRSACIPTVSLNSCPNSVSYTKLYCNLNLTEKEKDSRKLMGSTASTGPQTWTLHLKNEIIIFAKKIVVECNLISERSSTIVELLFCCLSICLCAISYMKLWRIGKHPPFPLWETG